MNSTDWAIFYLADDEGDKKELLVAQGPSLMEQCFTFFECVSEKVACKELIACLEKYPQNYWARKTTLAYCERTLSPVPEYMLYLAERVLRWRVPEGTTRKEMKQFFYRNNLSPIKKRQGPTNYTYSLELVLVNGLNEDFSVYPLTPDLKNAMFWIEDENRALSMLEDRGEAEWVVWYESVDWTSQKYANPDGTNREENPLREISL